MLKEITKSAEKVMEKAEGTLEYYRLAVMRLPVDQRPTITKKLTVEAPLYKNLVNALPVDLQTAQAMDRIIKAVNKMKPKHRKVIVQFMDPLKEPKLSRLAKSKALIIFASVV